MQFIWLVSFFTADVRLYVTELLQRHSRVLLQLSKLMQELLEAMRRAPRVLPLSGRHTFAS